VTGFERVALQGTLKNSLGTPLGSTEVSVIANGVEYTTFTDTKGEYQIFGAIEGDIELFHSAAIQLVPVRLANKNIDFRLAFRSIDLRLPFESIHLRFA
jgi:hypothetical protein